MARGFSSGLSFILANTALLFVVPPPLGAQHALPNGPAVGGTVDRFLYEGGGITAASLRVSSLRARAVGTEIGVALFPDALSAGALVLAPDLGAAFNASGPGMSVLVKGGLSALTGLGAGFAFEPGYHLGGGLIVQIGKRAGMRVDVVRHAYLIDNETEAIWSVGLGFTGLPRRATAE
jgi:hypothetical protein